MYMYVCIYIYIYVCMGILTSFTNYTEVQTNN